MAHIDFAKCAVGGKSVFAVAGSSDRSSRVVGYQSQLDGDLAVLTIRTGYCAGGLGAVGMVKATALAHTGNALRSVWGGDDVYAVAQRAASDQYLESLNGFG